MKGSASNGHVNGGPRRLPQDDLPVTSDDLTMTSDDLVTPEAQQHFSWIGKLTPCFAVSGRQVEVIRDPSVFYKTLLSEASKAKRRIVLASLYLGTSPLEEKLVNNILKSVSDSSTNNDQSKLSVEVLLDYSRGSRGQHNSRTMLLPLLKAFPEQVRVSLFHSPDLRGWRKNWLPERYNEIIGLQHMKVYMFDDNVLLTGANLSDSYFTNRQDRYVMIRHNAPLADFFHKLVQCVSSLSFSLKSDDTVKLAEGLEHHPYEGPDNGQAFRDEAKQRLEALLEPTQYSNSNQSSITTSKPSSSTPASSTTTTTNSSSDELDTWIYPLVQMSPFGIKIDDFVTCKLFQNMTQGSHLKMASGYFNLTEHYMSTILNESIGKYTILTASPEANGFHGARGISGAIPAAYTCIARSFHAMMCTRGQQERVHLQEYTREGWTFHGKGLWYYLPQEVMPSMTLIGSPNFGYRSVFRDLEAQVALVTKNTHLRKQLHLEQSELYSLSSPVTETTFTDPGRRVPMWVYYVTPIIRHFF